MSTPHTPDHTPDHAPDQTPDHAPDQTPDHASQHLGNDQAQPAAGPAQSDPAQSDPAQSGPAQSGQAQSGPAQSDPAQPETPQPEAAHSQAESDQPASDHAPCELEGLEDPFEDSELAQALARIEELEDQVARAKADYYNLNTEYGNYVRRAKEAVPGYKTEGHVEVLESLISVLDDIDAARQAGDLEGGPFAAIAHKLEDTLEHRFGMTRYGKVGEDFDPMLHEALMARPNPAVDHQVVGQVLQPGYTMKERTLRVAKVLVDNPE